MFVIFNVAFVSLQIVTLVVDARDFDPMRRLFIHPPQTASTLAKETLMLSIALVGAFNLNFRRNAAIMLVLAHLIAVAAQSLMYFAYPANPLFPDDHSYLLTGTISDAVVIILALYLVFVGRRQTDRLTQIEDIELRSPASTIFKISLFVMGLFCAAYAIAILIARVFASPDSSLGIAFGGPDPLITNSITRYGTFSAVFFWTSLKSSSRRHLLPPVIAALSLSVIATFIYIFSGDTTVVTSAGNVASTTWALPLQLVIDGALLGLVLGLRKLQYTVDFQITSFGPSSAECVMSAHQAVRELSHEPEDSSREVLHRLDEHIAEIHSRRRGLLAFPFWMLEHLFPILCGLRPPFSTMSREQQRWLLRRYILRPNYERSRSAIPAMADFMSQIGDVINALLSLSYFTTPRAHSQIGYVMPDARERLQSDIATLRPPIKVEPPNLPANPQDPIGKKPVSDPGQLANLAAPRIALASDFPPMPDEVDYCVVGSGAAGGVLAYRLAAQVGRSNSICLLERGGYNSAIRDFSDDELRMIRMLYTEGGLQMTRTFDFTILQGESVGGSTVINNAICIQMPDISRKEWQELGIDTSVLARHYASIKEEINIDELGSQAVNQTAESLFTKGVSDYNSNYSNLVRLSQAKRLAGNFNNCIGCGLCNIGCRRLRKLSVLETYIPWAQANGVQVFSNTGAVQCETNSNGKTKTANAVIVRKQNGEFQKIRIRKALIVAAGAIASSRFLMRSELGGTGVGRGLSCNYAFPTLVEFSEPINAFDGAQITMFAAPDSFEAIFETTYNPPGAHSITLPVHFSRHAEMMQAYRFGINFGALVGSDLTGSVCRDRDLMFGRAIEWRQTEAELKRIKNALATLARIGKAAGGKSIILPTHPALIMPLDSALEQTLQNMDQTLNHKQFFSFATAHPQGGNMMSDSSHDQRVTELDFRVRDCKNVFVCDASVFPRGIRVNPQWTIMALASYASERIAELT
jgi:choline dehydrogenase-like flavoprotein